MKHIIFLFFIQSLFHNSRELDVEKLESLGINGDFYVSDIAVYFNRAFLAIPRALCRNNVTHPTLVEIPWKEFNVILKSRFNKPIEGQIWANCDDLQNAVSLAKEGMKSKLWVLDKGNEFCPPKVMCYNMLQNSFLDGEVMELAGVPKNGLNSMVIENGTKFGDHRAFIANAGDNTVLVCYLKDKSCNHMALVEKRNPSMPIKVDFLSISKVDSTMYLTGLESTPVFSLEVEKIPDEYSGENATSLSTEVTFRGDKLGPSSGLETDLKNGLIYYLVRDYAVVRWSTEKPMQAEYHDVLAQSFKRMPYVSRIFTDPQGNVFALVNPFSPFTCPKETTRPINDDEEQRLERVIQLMKYNWILNTFF